MVAMNSKAVSNVVCETTHGPSQTMLRTDAPADMGGDASSFSPTDLVGTALLTCIMTTMGIVANRLGVDLAGMHGTVEKTMTATTPRRIAVLAIRLHMPAIDDADVREKLEHAAHHCPVHHSLHPDTEKNITITWG